MHSALKKLFLAITSFIVLTGSLPLSANDSVVVEKPTAFAMVGDAVVVRPVMLGISIVGTAAYLITLPFSLIGGNSKEAGDTLVVQPLKNTFVRCLGCVRSGYKKSVTKVEGVN